MITEEVVGRTALNGEEDGEKERLCMFENNDSIYIFYAFLDYIPLSGKMI